MHRSQLPALAMSVCVLLAATLASCAKDSVEAPPETFVALNQPPLPGTTQGLYSDQSCGAAGCTGQTRQSTADNFQLSRSASIIRIEIWGGYFPNNALPVVDNFTVILRSDNNGLPGPALHTVGIPAPRVATGSSFGSLREYRYILELPSSLPLAAGRHWVEIYNNTSGTTSNFTWERGSPDAAAGIPGCRYSPSTPGSNWSGNHPDWEMAIRIEAR